MAIQQLVLGERERKNIHTNTNLMLSFSFVFPRFSFLGELNRKQYNMKRLDQMFKKYILFCCMSFEGSLFRFFRSHCLLVLLFFF